MRDQRLLIPLELVRNLIFISAVKQHGVGLCASRMFYMAVVVVDVRGQ